MIGLYRICLCFIFRHFSNESDFRQVKIGAMYTCNILSVEQLICVPHPKVKLYIQKHFHLISNIMSNINASKMQTGKRENKKIDFSRPSLKSR